MIISVCLPTNGLTIRGDEGGTPGVIHFHQKLLVAFLFISDGSRGNEADCSQGQSSQKSRKL